ncbi:GDSL-type esterase/lipase family protein [Candidatus Avelusimicrobium alvi]|uniref:GDSL-type esterase/lipase family protein n=1 Tax=Candidatus Avelusimicrobium alvi TaxID=3416221 RepID=UPI003D0B8EC9
MKKWIGLLLVAACAYYFMKDTAEIKNLHNPGTAVVAFGDSLTAGYGAPKGSAYPAVLAAKLGREVVNLGMSGETAAHAPSRLPEVLAQNPHMVLIEFGANDFMQNRRMEDALAAVAEIVDAVQQAGAVAVIVDTGAPGMGHYSRAYKKLAEEKGAVFVPGILEGIFNKRQYKSDMVHPNAAGYEIVAERVYERIKPYLK